MLMKIFKKSKKPYPRSFAGRLTWRITLTLLIVMGLTSLLVVGTIFTVTYAQIQIFCDKLVDIKKDRIEHTLSEISIAATNTIPNIEQNLDNPERLFSIVEGMVKLNPRVRSCGISFIDNYYPQKGHWFCPYAVRRDSDQIEVRKIGDFKMNYLKSEWFNEALKTPNAYWAKPFFDGVDSVTALVAYVAPIHNKKGETVAILGVDLSLEYLNQDSQINHLAVVSDSSEWTGDYKMYFFAIDSTGRYLIHPDKERILRENFLKRAKKTPSGVDDILAEHMVSRINDSMDSDEENENDLFVDGERVTAFFAPINNTNWSLAFIIPNLFINVLIWMLLGLLLAFILMGILVVFFASRRGIKKISKPLIQLANSADEVAKGNFKTQLPNINSRDEIHQLRDSFENMQHSLTRYIDELRDTTAQKASMESELKIAHDIQMDMLPKTFPPYPERTDIDIYGSLTPAKGVAGDLFDFYIRDNQLFFCVGDVSGKGIPASLFMAVARSLFRNISAHVAFPERIAYTLNNALSEGNETNMFVTLFTGVLDLSTGHLRYCNAGHDAPVLVGRDVGELPCLPNLPLGIIPNFEFEAQEVDIDPQTTIFLFTDGLTEAENSRHDQFGEERIQKVAARLLSMQQHQPQVFIEQMLQEVHRFVAGAEQSDDLTMLAIQYRGEKREVKGEK